VDRVSTVNFLGERGRRNSSLAGAVALGDQRLSSASRRLSSSCPLSPESLPQRDSGFKYRVIGNDLGERVRGWPVRL
jgi:hypothetical protein